MDPIFLWGGLRRTAKKQIILILQQSRACRKLLSRSAFRISNKNSQYNTVALMSRRIVFLLSSVQFSCSILSDSLQPHELQHARPPYPSATAGVYTNPCPLSRWCHPTISSSVVLFFSCPQVKAKRYWLASSTRILKNVPYKKLLLVGMDVLSSWGLKTTDCWGIAVLFICLEILDKHPPLAPRFFHQ